MPKNGASTSSGWSSWRPRTRIRPGTDDIAAFVHAIREFDAAVQVAYDFYRRDPKNTLLIVTGDHETGGLSVTYAQTELSPSSSKRFYAGPEHLKLVSGISISLEKAKEMLDARRAGASKRDLVADLVGAALAVAAVAALTR